MTKTGHARISSKGPRVFLILKYIMFPYIVVRGTAYHKKGIFCIQNFKIFLTRGQE
jgi:hypothetical protein